MTSAPHTSRPRDAAGTAAQAPAPVAASPPRKQRDPWFDSAKMLLVLLVVVGHAWTLLPDTAVNDRLYNWLYLWHMPAFVIVTGYLSKRFELTRQSGRTLVTQLVIPYLVFEGLFALFRANFGGESFENLWLNPHWPMWFLVALLFWRLVTPLLRRTRHPLALAVVASLASGLFSVEAFDLNRLLGLLPFYVLGMQIEQRHLDLVRSTATRVLGLGVLAFGVWISGVVEYDLETEWLYYRTSYAATDADPLTGMGVRLMLMVVAVAMAAAALAWIPQRGGWFARMGAASLVVYLWHGFFVKGALYAGVPGWAEGHPVLSLVVVTAAAALLALALAWRPVAKPLEKVITPDG